MSIKLIRDISQGCWEAVSVHIEVREGNDSQPQILNLGTFNSELYSSTWTQLQIQAELIPYLSHVHLVGNTIEFLELLKGILC